MAEQQKPAITEFTDSELIELANDPSVTSQDLARLTSNEQRRFMALRQSKPTERSTIDQAGEAISALGDAGVGAMKGLGESVFNLGSAVRQIPGVGHATDFLAELFGPEGTDAEKAFAQTPAELAPANTAESVGKTVEQIAEFLIPAGKVGPLARRSADLVGKVGKGTGPLRRRATDAAWKAAPIADDALGAAGVAALHGDETPESAALWSAGGGAMGQAGSQLARLLSTPTGAKLGPLLAAIAAMSTIEGLGAGTAGSMGAGLGTFGVARQIANSALRKPGAVGRLRWAAEDAGQRGGTLAAGVADQARTPRRRSEK